MPGSALQTTGSSFQKERTGLLHFECKFYIDGPRGDDTAEPYDLLLSFKPDSVPFNLPEVGRNASKLDDGDWLLVITYEGLKQGQQTFALLEVDHAGAEDPIESFPHFWDKNPTSISEKYKAQSDGVRFTGFKKTIKDPSTGQEVTNPMYGQGHFLNDNPVLRITFLAEKWDMRWVDNICKIESSMIPPSVLALFGNTGNKSWLKRSVKGTFRGNVWEISVEWLLGVWNTDVYGAKTQASAPAELQNAKLEDNPD